MKKNKLYLKYFLSVTFLLAAIYFLRKSAGTLKETWSIFKSGDEIWVLAAIAVEFLAYYFFVMMYKFAFMAASVKRRLAEMVPLILSANVLNVLAPAADTASYLLFIEDAKRKQEPVTNMLVAVNLAAIIDFSAFTFILIFADIYLHLFRELTTYQIIASLLFVGLTATFATLLYLGLNQRSLLKRILTLFNEFIYRIKRIFVRGTKRSPGWVELVDRELEGAAMAVKGNTKPVIKAAMFSLLFHFTNVLILACAFHAFDQHFKIGVLVTGYAIGFVFKVVAPVPQGIGVVEGIMSLTYASLGIPLANALAIVLLFRGVSLWLPLLAGLFTFQRYNLKTASKT